MYLGYLNKYVCLRLRPKKNYDDHDDAEEDNYDEDEDKNYNDDDDDEKNDDNDDDDEDAAKVFWTQPLLCHPSPSSLGTLRK